MVGRTWLFLWMACRDPAGQRSLEPTPDGSGDSEADGGSDLAALAMPCADGSVSSELPAMVVGDTTGQPDDLALSFVAPADGRYALTTLRSASEQPLSVYDGCGGGALGDSHSQRLVTASLASGQTVLIVLTGEGPFVLDVFAVEPSEKSCIDGLDNDVDLAPDCLDSECASEPACAPRCPDQVSLGALPASASGSTVGRSDDDALECNASCASASDASIAFTAPASGGYGLQVTGHGFEPALAALDGCQGRTLACGRGTLAVELQAGQTLVAVVEGCSDPPEGIYTVSLFHREQTERSCDDGLDNDIDQAIDSLDRDCSLPVR